MTQESICFSAQQHRIPAWPLVVLPAEGACCALFSAWAVWRRSAYPLTSEASWKE